MRNESQTRSGHGTPCITCWSPTGSQSLLYCIPCRAELLGCDLPRFALGLRYTKYQEAIPAVLSRFGERYSELLYPLDLKPSIIMVGEQIGIDLEQSDFKYLAATPSRVQTNELPVDSKKTRAQKELE